MENKIFKSVRVLVQIKNWSAKLFAYHIWQIGEEFLVIVS